MKKPCPMCKGRPVTTMQSRIKDSPCELCGGDGVVDPDRMCKCGRPAVVPIGNDKYTCTRGQCIEKALNPVSHGGLGA